MQIWVAKATAASGDPPKQKHVRRIVAATVKQPSIAGGVLTSLFDRPWQADPRVAAKVLYIVLLIFQFSANVSADAGGPVMEIGRANQSPKKKTNWTVTAVCIASLISSKLKCHGVSGGLEGNFASPGQTRPRGVTDNLAAIASLADFVIELAAGAGDFAINVLACPIVEELSKTYVLARWSGETQGPDVKNAGTVLSRAGQLSYLVTAVEYPDPTRRAPVQRFPQSEQ